jgi:hypothetical protein
MVVRVSLSGSLAGAEARSRKLDDAGGRRRSGRLEETSLEDAVFGRGRGRLRKQRLRETVTKIEKLS